MGLRYSNISPQRIHGFVDVMDEVSILYPKWVGLFSLKLTSAICQVLGILDDLPQKVYTRYLRTLYRICGLHTLLPKSLLIPRLCYNPADGPECSGGFADVWKGKYLDKEVAAKVLKIRSKSELKIRRVGFRPFVVLSMY